MESEKSFAADLQKHVRDATGIKGTMQSCTIGARRGGVNFSLFFAGLGVIWFSFEGAAFRATMLDWVVGRYF